MQRTVRHAARAVVLTPDEKVLVLRFRFLWLTRDLWITPGGGIEPEEPVEVALTRELHEETGLVEAPIGPELWSHRHDFDLDGRPVEQRERYSLVATPHFEPRALALDAGNETSWFRGFRWWPLSDLPEAGERFAPRTFGKLLRQLVREGPPERPFGISV